MVHESLKNSTEQPFTEHRLRSHYCLDSRWLRCSHVLRRAHYCSRREIRFNSERSREKWGFAAKERCGGQWWRLLEETARWGRGLLAGLSRNLAEGRQRTQTSVKGGEGGTWWSDIQGGGFFLHREPGSRVHQAEGFRLTLRPTWGHRRAVDLGVSRPAMLWTVVENVWCWG